MAIENAGYERCNGCRFFEDKDWKGCASYTRKVGIDDCFSPHLVKRPKCSVCGSHFVYMEGKDGKKYCRNCSDGREL